MAEKSNSPTLLAGRYAFQQRISSLDHGVRWLALDSRSGRTVVAELAPAHRVRDLDAARGVTHRHLAELSDVIRSFERSAVPSSELPEGAVIAIAEHLPGQTLDRMIAEQRLAPGKAVAWTLRLIEATQALHAKGAVHGAISPWSIVAEPGGRAIAPALAQLAAPPIGAFCSPERLKGAAPTQDDDVWALHATLYMALTGKLLYEGQKRDLLARQMLMSRPRPLSDFRVNEPVLTEILQRGLVGEKRLRVSDLTELARSLDGWERDPKAMPAKRPPAPRVAPRSVSDLVSGARANPEEIIVIDPTVLPDDEDWSVAAPSVTGTNAPAAAAAPAIAPATTNLPPPLPTVTAMPPRLPVMSGPPPLPVVSAPPPLPVPSGPPPLPSALVSAAPPLQVQVSPPPPAAVPAPSAPAAAMPVSLQALSADLPPQVALPAPTPVHVPVARRLSHNPFEKKRRVWPIAAAAALVSGLGVYFAVGGNAASTIPAASTTAVVQPLKTKAPEKPRLSANETANACVRSYFSDFQIEASADFSFVCGDSDFREISRQVFSVVRDWSRPTGADTKTAHAQMLSADGLGWYELAAAGIIRKSCCANAAPVNLPQTVGWCEQLQTVVRRVSDDSAKAGDLAPGAKSFDKAVNCLYATKVMRPYTYDHAPTASQRKGFQDFLSLAAISEARR